LRKQCHSAQSRGRAEPSKGPTVRAHRRSPVFMPIRWHICGRGAGTSRRTGQLVRDDPGGDLRRSPWRACWCGAEGGASRWRAAWTVRALIFDVNGTLVDWRTDGGAGRRLRLWPAPRHQGVLVGWRRLARPLLRDDAAPAAAARRPTPNRRGLGLACELLEQQATTPDPRLPRRRCASCPVPGGDAPGADAGSGCGRSPGPRGAGNSCGRTTAGRRLRPPDAYGLPELRAVGLGDFFDPVVISADTAPQARPPALPARPPGVRARPDQAL